MTEPLMMDVTGKAVIDLDGIDGVNRLQGALGCVVGMHKLQQALREFVPQPPPPEPGPWGVVRLKDGRAAHYDDCGDPDHWMIRDVPPGRRSEWREWADIAPDVAEVLFDGVRDA